MDPILFIHGYSSEGRVNTKKESEAQRAKNIKAIYGDLPKLLKEKFGSDKIQTLNLSRWISLDDGVSLDDISFAMQRALQSKEHNHLMLSGFHVVIHSTGALVVRNWIKNYSPFPCPINNLIHLAGANFGSGLAHIGRGQLARWGRFIMRTEPGAEVLTELEFGNSKTIDLHRYFLQPGNRMLEDYQVQEFSLIGSQVGSGILKPVLETIPIRYVKEDSSDNTVRTAATNLNFNYLALKPKPKAYQLTAKDVEKQIEKRESSEQVNQDYYDVVEDNFADSQIATPFALLYETAHFGGDIGIVDGEKNRTQVFPPLVAALKTPFDDSAYQKTKLKFDTITDKTLQRAAKSKRHLFKFWSKQGQYESHAQVIVRLRDQYGQLIEHHDITFNSDAPKEKGQEKIEWLIEDKHQNKKDAGSVTYYLRTSKFNKNSKKYRNRLDSVMPLNLEITAYEKGTNRIAFVPVNFRIETSFLQKMIQNFRTTVIDIEMARLPKIEVFDVLKV